MSPIDMLDILQDKHVAEVLQRVLEVISRGGKVFFKWTCGGCRERAATEEVNTLHTSWVHEDCGYETATVNEDLGFFVVFSREE